MKKVVLAIAASAAALISFGGTANAAPYQSINQRKHSLEMRIDQGVRMGALTRAEATGLRNQMASIERLERNLRRNGLTAAERRLIERRLDALSRNIRVQMTDNQVRGPRHFHR